MILKTSFLTFLGASLLGIGYNVHIMTRGADSVTTDIAFAICLPAYILGLGFLAAAIKLVVDRFRPLKTEPTVLIYSNRISDYLH